MKIVNKALAILTAFFAITAVSCNYSVSDSSGSNSGSKSTTTNNKTYMVATVDDFIGNVARTVLPEVELSDFSEFEVQGSLEKAAYKSLASFTSYEQMENSSISISAGTWDLVLKATVGDTLFESVVEDVNIISGRNVVNFSLKMKSFGSYGSSVDGGIMFTLNLPEESAVAKGVISLETYDGSSSSSEFTNYEVEVVNNQIVYTSSTIDPGYYRLSIKLYGDSDCLLYLNTYKEIVVVASGLTSTAERTMDVAEKVYTIDYRNITAENVLANYTLTETVTRHSAKIILPTVENLSKNGCTFLGWYTTANFADGTEITSIENVTSDLVIYAKWDRNYYTITYVNGGNHSNPVQYRYGEGLTFTAPVVPEGNEFLGWYTSDEFETEINGISSTDFGDVTVYAKYNFTEYTITYVAYVGGVQDSTVPVSSNPTSYKFINEITFEIPAKPGYILKGFYTSSNFADDERIDGIALGSTGNKTVYLQYITNEISASYLNDALDQLKDGKSYKIVITDTNPDLAVVKQALNNHKDIIVELDLSSSTGLTEIPNNAFQIVKNVTSITLPDSVTTINNYAFAGATSLESVTLGSGLTTIGNRAFQGATALKEIEIPSSVTTINDYAFAGTNELEIVIPSTVTTLGDYVFYGSKNNTITVPSAAVFAKAPASENGVNNMLRMSTDCEIILSDNPASIPDYAFAGINGIKISIPQSVSVVGSKIFNNVSDANITASYQLFNSSISSSGSALLEGLSNCEFSFTNPDVVTSIPDYAFYNSGVTKFDIPEGVTSIGEKAFAGTTFDSIVLPENLTTIKDEAFANIDNLEITVPVSVTSLANSAFKNDDNLKLSIDIKHINNARPNNYGTSYYNALLKDIKSVDITILETSTVTYINNYAFNNTSNVKSVSIPSCIRSIYDYAFAYATGLSEITIPNSVTSIGNYVFWYAGKTLDEGWTITIPLKLLNSRRNSNSSSYGNYLFNQNYGSSCYTNPFNLIITNPEDTSDANYTSYIASYTLCNATKMKSVIFPENITEIGAYAFYNCNSITEVTIPETVTTMGTYALANCSELQTVTYDSESIIATSEYAFSGTNKLETVKVQSLEVWKYWSTRGSYSYSPFYGTTSSNTISTKLYIGNELLTSVVIPEDETSINSAQYCNIDSITSVDLGKVKTINKYAFAYCNNITEIVIPETVNSYGDNVFDSCKNLVKITYENTERLNSGSSWFINCSNIEAVYVKNWNVWNNWIRFNSSSYSPFYSATEKNTKLYVNNKLVETYVVPETQTVIFNGQFMNIQSLKKVVFHDEVTAINYYAFKNCKNLTNITLPDSVSKIEESAFNNTAITAITIPPKVTELGKEAFRNCKQLTSVIYKNETLLPTGQNAFYDCTAITKISVPSIDVWCNWSSKGTEYSPLVSARNAKLYINNKLANKVTLPEGLTSVSASLFRYVNNLQEVEISSSVTSIGDYSFADCPNLTKFIVPETVTSIGSYVFMNDKVLEEVVIPNSVTSIGSYVFVHCGSNEEGAETLAITMPLKLLNSKVYSNSSNTNYLFGGSSYDSSNNYCATYNFTLTLTNPTDTEDTNYASSLNNYALCNLKEMKSVTLPDNITSIGNYAFYNCNNLTSFAIPANIKTIGSYAFYSCTKLESIEIPDGATTIGEYAFYKCSGLRSLTIPNSVTSLGSFALTYCGSKEEGAETLAITMPLKLLNNKIYSSSSYTNYLFGGSSYESGNYYCAIYNFTLTLTNPSDTSDENYASSLNNYALCNLKEMKSVTLPDNITSIGNYAFYRCNSLAGVVDIPDTVTTIGDNAFYNCTNLSSLVIPANVKTIGSYAFYNCTSLETINIEGVETIGSYAFYNCKKLESIEIPDGATTIGEYAFFNCSGLRSLIIPNSVTSIGNYAFVYCGSKADGAETLEITMPLKPLNSKYYSNSYATSYTNYLFGGSSYDNGNNYCATYNFTLTLTNPTDTEDTNYASSLNNYALCNLKEMKSVTLPDNITSIGDYAFYNCTKLESIEVPDGAKTIGKYAFYCCSGLKNIIIPNSVTSIGDYAFVYCGSKADGAETLEITMPLKALNNKAYSINQFTNNLFGGSAYDNGNNFCATYNFTLTLTNPTNTSDANYASSLYNYALCNLKEMKSVTLPDNITSIGNYAFYKCYSLTSLDIPDSVKTIGEYAFSYCTNLESIEIPEGATTIGAYAFYYSSGLKSIVIPNSVTSIGYYAFVYCGSKDDGAETLEITMPLKPLNDKVYSNTSNTNYLFGGSSYGGSGNNYCAIYNFNLTLTNPTDTEDTNYVSSLNNYALCNLKEMKSVTLPDNITSIGSYAFYRCYGLTSVNIPDAVTSIGDYAFDYCNNLESVEKAGEVTTIGNSAFYYCNKLTSVNISAVTSIGSYAFGDCTSLESIDIPVGVTTIGENAFYDCTALTSIIIPDSVTSLGNYAFNNAGKSIDEGWSITMPLKLLNSRANSSSYCNKLFTNGTSSSSSTTKAFNLILTNPAENHADSLANYALCHVGNQSNSTYGVKSVILPEDITSIGDYAFYYDSNLTEIDIPESVTSIGTNAFTYCTGLEHIVIPDTVTSLGNCVFNYAGKTMDEGWTITMSLKLLNSGANSSSYCNKLFTNGTTSGSPTTKAFNLVLTNPAENHADSLANYALCHVAYNSNGMKSVELPDDIISIGSYAFYYDSNLTEIDIPESVTSIGANAFAYCSGLEELFIPEGVTSIGTSVFTNVPYVHNHSNQTNASNWGATACSALTDYTVITPSTCISHGSASFKCNKTGCEYNGETAKVVELPFAPHTYDSGVEQSAATCIAKKVVRYTCTVSGCGDYYDEEEGDLIEHNIDSDTGNCTLCGGSPHLWVIETSSSSYYFVNNSGNIWSSNNKSQNSTTASSTWTIEITGNASYSIPWTVSSESNCDTLTITVDGVTEVSSVSGINSGTIMLTLSAGTHTVIARYKKDGSVNSNDDTATITLNPVYY